MNKIYDFITSTSLMLSLHVFVLILLIVLIYMFVKSINNNNLVNTLYKRAKENESKRKEYEEALLIVEGRREEESKLYKLDVLIEQSRIKKHIKIITSEILIMIYAIMITSAIVLLIVFNASIIISVIALSTTVLTPVAILKVLAKHNNDKISDQMIKFLDLVENYAKTSDDIIDIFGKVYVWLDNPLREEILNCYNEAIVTGNIEFAFKRLEAKLPNNMSKDIIRNIEICSRYEANYVEIVRQSKQIVRINRVAATNRKRIISDARIEIGIILGVSFFLLKIVDGFINNKLISILTGSLIGQILIVYMGLVLIYSLYTMISINDD